MMQRPVGLSPQYIPAQNIAYHQPMINQRVAARPIVTHQPTYVQGMPIHVQPAISPQQYYSQPYQTVPIQGYMPHYQPMYVQAPPIAQPISPYYNPYVQPVYPYRNTHPQMELNRNFDYEEANFLTDTKIVQNTVYCVICGNNFKASEKDQHLKKHMRKTDNSTLLVDLPTKSAIESKVGSKKQYYMKPLVEPEEHTIQYEPLVYQIVQEVLYKDTPTLQTDYALNHNNSFGDQNMSFDQKSMQIPNKKVSSLPPIVPKTQGLQPGNCLNEPVPFVGKHPSMRNSVSQANEKLNESILSNVNNATNPPITNRNSVSHGIQAGNSLQIPVEPKKT